MDRNMLIDGFLALIHDDEFRRLFITAENEALPWRQFQDKPMPRRYTPEQVWAILTALRRIKAHVISIDSYAYPQPVTVWCSINKPIAISLEHLSSYASSQNHVDDADRTDDKSNEQDYSQDIAAGMERDGFIVDPHVITGLQSGSINPSGAAERVAQNTLIIMQNLERYSRYPLSPLTVDDFITRLDAGCKPILATTSSRDNRYQLYERTTRDMMLSNVCDVLNKMSACGDGFPLIDLIAISFFIWDFMMLRKWSGVLEVILRHLALEKAGLGRLRCIPLSRLCLDWQNEASDDKTKRAPTRWEEIEPEIGEGADLTIHVGYCLKMMTDYLDGLSTADIRSRQLENRISKVIRDNQLLNYRQQETLCALIRNNATPITIDGYMSLYKISYATARNDLTNLSKMDYLVESRNTRTLNFVLSPRFKAKLDDTVH